MGFIRRGNYEHNTIEEIVDIVKHNIRSELENMKINGKTAEESKAFAQQLIHLMSRSELIIEDKCYIGITANPIQSLTAHGIDVYAENTFTCIDIPSADASECRNEIIKLDGFEPYTDESNDYIDDTFEQLYIYIYKISNKTNEKIDNAGFTPLKQLPQKPIIIKITYINGSSDTKYYEELSHRECDRIIDEINSQINKNNLTELIIVHRELNRIYAEFGNECCIINYDNGTSQSGGYQSFRSEEKSRKKVQLFINEYPEYMLCRDFNVFEGIIRYFLTKGKKPAKRQNVKWVNVKG